MHYKKRLWSITKTFSTLNSMILQYMKEEYYTQTSSDQNVIVLDINMKV